MSCHEGGGSDCDGVVVGDRLGDVLERDVTAEVDDVESGDLQHDGCDILSNGVDISLDGADDELSEVVGGLGLFTEVGGQDVDSCVHCVGCRHDVGQEQFLLLVEVSDLVDSNGVSVLDQVDDVCILVKCILRYFLGLVDVVGQNCFLCSLVKLFLGHFTLLLIFRPGIAAGAGKAFDYWVYSFSSAFARARYASSAFFAMACISFRTSASMGLTAWFFRTSTTISWATSAASL